MHVRDKGVRNSGGIKLVSVRTAVKPSGVSIPEVAEKEREREEEEYFEFWSTFVNMHAMIFSSDLRESAEI